MRVMQIMAGAPVGGIETFYVDALCALAQRGLTQYAIVRPNLRNGLERLRASDIRYAAAAFDSWWRWPTERVVKRAVAEFKPDIIQYWTGRAASYAPKTAACQVGWYGGYRRRRDFRSCTDFIVITTDLMRHLREQGVLEDRAALVHIFAEPRSMQAVERATLATPAHAPLLLVLSRLDWTKGVDVLLNALTFLPDAYLWIAGEGPARQKLVEQCGALALSDRVRFLGWRTDRDALLAAADVCVFPSSDDSFGAVIIEAWAAGRPLVAAAAQGPSTYVQNGKNGVLVPVNDPQSLAAGIRAVIDDADLRTVLVEGGRRSFAGSFTKDIYVAQMLSFYERLAGARSSSAARKCRSEPAARAYTSVGQA